MPPSAREVVRALERLGFEVESQHGSHVKLRQLVDGKVVTVIVPWKREIPTGTLGSITRQAGLTLRDLLRNI